MRSARSKLPLIEPPTCATRSRGLRISPSACDTRRRPSTSYRDLGAALSSEITPDQIRSELSTVLSWGDFATSPQLARFLQHVVNQSLGGREAMLKERNIALHALGRDRDFNPQIDPIVRVLAGRLRRALERYYGGDGAQSPIRIDIPKGGYRPVFAARCDLPSRGELPPGNPDGRELSDGKLLTLRPVLAVVPFVVFTRGERERQLAEAVAHDVCVQLSRSTWIEVVDYLAAIPLCDKPYAPADVAARLKADFCLTGTVRTQGNLIRMTLQLIDTRSGTLIWARQFDLGANHEDVVQFDTAVRETTAGVGDIFGVLATAVWRMSREKPILQLTACEATLRNLIYQSHLSDGLFADAFSTAERAVKVDPEFAWGWVALGLLHLDRFSLIATGETHDAAEQALASARRALKVDPTCAFAYWIVAAHHLMRGQLDEAVSTAEAVVEHAIGSPFEMAAAGAVLSAAGEHERGQALIHRATAINPRLPGWIQWGTAIHDFGQGRYASALATTQRFTLPDCFWDHLFTAAAWFRVGETELAKSSLQRVRQLRPEVEERSTEVVSMIVRNPEVQEDLLDSLQSAGLRAK
jgi:TolB-like protein